jgi:Beta/Gamma crystallin
MNFKTIITISIATFSSTTLTLANLSAQANPGPVLNYNSPSVVKDVTLFSRGINRGQLFESDEGVADLRAVGFDNRASAIRVNNDKKWRFYKDKNFQGEFIEVGPKDTRRHLGNFNNKISSFKSVK